MDSAVPIRLLLVEDNPADVWLMKEALRLAPVPAQLSLACDGREALRQLHQAEAAAQPDLILLDLNLPRCGGLEILRDLKRSPSLRHIPVVVLSSSRAAEDRRRAEALQAEAFLTKPDNLPDYVAMVRRLTWLRPAAAEALAHAPSLRICYKQQ